MNIIKAILFAQIFFFMTTPYESTPAADNQFPWLNNPKPINKGNTGRGAYGGGSSGSSDESSEKSNGGSSLGGGASGGGNTEYKSNREKFQKEFAEIGDKSREVITKAEKEGSASTQKNTQEFSKTIEKMQADQRKVEEQSDKSLEKISKELSKKDDGSTSAMIQKNTDALVSAIQQNSNTVVESAKQLSKMLIPTSPDGSKTKVTPPKEGPIKEKVAGGEFHRDSTQSQMGDAMNLTPQGEKKSLEHSGGETPAAVQEAGAEPHNHRHISPALKSSSDRNISSDLEAISSQIYNFPKDLK